MNGKQKELIIRAFYHIEDILSNREPSYTEVMDNRYLEPMLREELGDRIVDAFNLARKAAERQRP